MRHAKKVDARTLAELINWYRAAHRGSWRSLEDVRIDFPTADRVGGTLIFDISRNAYRLIVTHQFPWNKLFVKALLTHKEYDRKEWLKWS
jgi:mRNA interferase HigB